MLSTWAATKSAGLCAPGVGAGAAVAIAEADVAGGGGVVDVAGFVGSFFGASSALADADVAGGLSSGGAAEAEGAADADRAADAEGVAAAVSSLALAEASIGPRFNRGRFVPFEVLLEGGGSSRQPKNARSGTTRRKMAVAGSAVLPARLRADRSSMGDQRV